VNKTLRFVVPALIVLVLAAGGSWLYAQVSTLPDTRHLSARSGQRIVTLEVGGLHCDQCVAVVKGQLSHVRGVSAVEVRLGQKRRVRSGGARQRAAQRRPRRGPRVLRRGGGVVGP
jgi:copper chaperone CopZ